jgi:hypothetical protein
MKQSDENVTYKCANGHRFRGKYAHSKPIGPNPPKIRIIYLAKNGDIKDGIPTTEDFVFACPTCGCIQLQGFTRA